MQLNIRFKNGTLDIDIEKYIDMKRISEFKKLVKLIEKSENPEILYDAYEYLEAHVVGTFTELFLMNERELRTAYKLHEKCLNCASFLAVRGWQR